MFKPFLNATNTLTQAQKTVHVTFPCGAEREYSSCLNALVAIGEDFEEMSLVFDSDIRSFDGITYEDFEQYSVVVTFHGTEEVLIVDHLTYLTELARDC